ncbi:DUF169 domain-containing protein [Desulfallas thermosapovorans]|uniref:Uncharacterized protein (DUF169 family) n=1 Tax=Desulfallas thermosapovorans DSM 6562 TaxID=1121431 RepID=A0A5S4ZNT6_9FIRM|nr:DUF169 domain-containing protein [Desulfallas thermosapovorans]TYO93937.1 uncharacterized protein (DUF169 family) [Desulfallas thermosapovorans DSM 6562]
MQSKIAKAIELKYYPIAVLHTNEKPEGALQFKEKGWGCVAAMLNGAAKGKTVVFDRKTFGCLGGGVGLGFGNQYEHFPGGIESFLSTGNKEFCNTEMGKNIVRNIPALEHGEGYIKSPELARKFIDSLPMRDIPEKYVVFKPLDQVTEEEEPKNIIFLVNPDQLSALVVLANYARETNDNVTVQFGAGCHQTCLIPYHEGESDNPRAVIGLTDISVRKQFEKDILSFTVPYKMFLEMESNVEGSFLDRDVWQKVLQRNRPK